MIFFKKNGLNKSHDNNSKPKSDKPTTEDGFKPINYSRIEIFNERFECFICFYETL